jgi:hypothetical protein
MHRFRECVYATYELDLETLVFTRCAVFPISMLAERLRCPRSGSRRVAFLFGAPANEGAKRP